MDLKEARFRTEAVINRHPWELARLEVINDIAGRTFERINGTGGIVLDMGCGDTWFVEQLSARYANIQFIAIDINFTDEALRQLNEKNKHTHIQVFKTLGDARSAISGAVIRAVLLLDVIEHISDDVAFLEWMLTFHAINLETQFIITVPAFQSLFSRHDVFLEHYRRYNNAMLEKHLRRAGLTTERKGYFFFSLLLARAAAVVIEKISKNNKPTTGLVQWNKSNFVTSLIKNMLLLDHYAVKICSKVGLNLPGLSNYILCRKSA